MFYWIYAPIFTRSILIIVWILYALLAIIAVAIGWVWTVRDPTDRAVKSELEAKKNNGTFDSSCLQ